MLHGVHGRRRAGLGETFWQFRPFVAGESTSRIDWRRSARDERLYVREREWEAAHTVMVWIDRSASMYFSSKLALQPKIDRALVLGLAAADLLIRGGERVGLLGLTRPLAARNIVERFGEVLLAEERGAGLRAGRTAACRTSLPRNSQAVLIGDFLSDPGRNRRHDRIRSASAARAAISSWSPIRSRRPFPSPAMSNSSTSIRPRGCASARLGSFRADYMRRLTAHRDVDPGGGARARLDLDAAPDRPAGLGGAAGSADAA